MLLPEPVEGITQIVDLRQAQALTIPSNIHLTCSVASGNSTGGVNRSYFPSVTRHTTPFSARTREAYIANIDQHKETEIQYALTQGSLFFGSIARVSSCGNVSIELGSCVVSPFPSLKEIIKSLHLPKGEYELFFSKNGVIYIGPVQGMIRLPLTYATGGLLIAMVLHQSE